MVCSSYRKRVDFGKYAVKARKRYHREFLIKLMMMLLQGLIISSFLFQTITSMQISYRRSNPQDIPTCFEIESASYPSDEAASLASLQYRQRHANDYFQCAMKGEEIIGFICATRCDDFEDEAVMSTHKEDGKLLGIHSVVVREDQRRKGIASDFLKNFIEKPHFFKNVLAPLFQVFFLKETDEK